MILRRSLPELKPCPFCGSKDIRQEKVVGWGTTVFFTCDSCKTSGPMCFDENDAIAAWNARTADKLIERKTEHIEQIALDAEKTTTND